ncbi:protein of unknown function [Kyrpidia spormannii]|uniref:Uncharacterized protein n=2 Tax=Kyrpidia spormannii TaxID=2055160 RepID=A0ACA8Z8D9_9BACL|nr:protein of unknown function [Kyrpidia spormannii]CAB3392777.1 protein of unknown function [Kyrpidia spormannii]
MYRPTSVQRPKVPSSVSRRLAVIGIAGRRRSLAFTEIGEGRILKPQLDIEFLQGRVRGNPIPDRW